MKIAICYLTRNKNSFNLSKLIEQANTSKHHTIDIYEYVNLDCQYIVDGNTIYFNFDDFREKFHWPYIYNNDFNGVGTKESTMFLPWLDMYTNHKGEYDMYLFMEDDIGYFGHKNFFDAIDFECDAIFATDRVLMSTWDWMWYYHPYYLDRNIIKDDWHGLCNIFGFKSNLIDEFIQFIKDGNFAHFEWILSSFAMNKDIEIHCISHYMKTWNSFVKGEIPNMPFYDFVHPIKDINEYNNYLEIHKNKIV